MLTPLGVGFHGCMRIGVWRYLGLAIEKSDTFLFAVPQKEKTMEEFNKSNGNIDESVRWHFFNLYCLALSDLEFNPKEKELLYRIGLEYGITEDTINNIVVTSGLSPVVPETLEEKIHYLYDLTRMAWADGIIEESEKALLRKYILLFGFHDENTEDIMEYFLTSVKEKKTIEQIINEIKS